MNDLIVTGLLDLGLSNEHTTTDRQVFPILSYDWRRDSEQITFPNPATMSFII
jgi:hypothetical protein